MLNSSGNMPRKLEASQIAGSGVVFITAATTLAVYQSHVNCTANTTYPSYSITLPAVAEAEGCLFEFMATIANSQAVTVQDQDDSDDWADLTLDTDNDYAAIYSDGRKWTIVDNEIA